LPPLDHEKFLRRSFEVARGARGSGHHPFGAILVDAAGAVLLEVETGFMPDRAMTGHAERLGDGREERFLGWRRVRRISLEQNLPADAM
jgi:tRNA(Arg) A34 adenosine deaminase TadA